MVSARAVAVVFGSGVASVVFMFEDTFCRKGLNIIFLAEWKVSGIQGFGFGFPGTTRDTKLCASRAVINFELNV